MQEKVPGCPHHEKVKLRWQGDMWVCPRCGEEWSTDVFPVPEGAIAGQPSRTPRPAHPAELAADRLEDMRQRYTEEGWFTDDELEAFATVRRALWRVARNGA